MLLREVTGETNNTGCESCKVKLDEKVVDKSEVEKKQEDLSTRIVEKSPGEFKTLQKLHG
jgi:hypothetical protein